jgi:hypothetical protein
MTSTFKDEHTNANKCANMPTKEEVKKFYEAAYKVYEDFYSPDSIHKDASESVDMFCKIAALWRDLISDNSDVWFEGFKVIGEALGETYAYWNTDVVDQLDFCEELAKLAGLDFEENSNK